MHRRSLSTILLFSTAALAACGSADNDNSREHSRITTADIREEAAPAAMGVPDISPSAAPGVAFSYRYAFVLPDDRIAAVQEQHAGACEKLGPGRCRIAGMRYTLVEEDKVEAYLIFKLAPDLARQFGKNGIAAIEKADGKLVDALIAGDDVGSQISVSQNRSASIEAELARTEARLKVGGLGDRERTELQQQAAALRQQLAGESETRATGEEQLANTPMTFTYSGAGGFRLGTNPFSNALHRTWDSAATMVSVLLLAVGVGLPWLLCLLVVVVLWRSRPGRALRQFLSPASPAGDQTVAAPPAEGTG